MKVEIRPLQMSDAHTSVKWRNMPELWVHTTFKATREITLQDELDWVDRVTNDPSGARFAILADAEYIGNIYLTNTKDGSAEYHIFIGEKSYWGKGVARAASVKILDYGKDVLNLQKVTLHVKADNQGAYHLYSTLGFKENGKDENGFTGMELDLRKWHGDPRARM